MSPEYSVEGEWGEFYFRMIKQEDIPEILKFLKKSFYPDETMFSLVGYSDALADEVNQVVDYYISKNDQLSFMAIHTQTNQIAGVNIIYGDEANSERPNTPVIDPDHIRILPFVQSLSQGRVLHEEFGLDVYADLFMTAVDAQFRRRGLVSEMYSRTLKLLHKRGYKLVESYFTSPYTRKAGTKNGFREISRVYYADALLEDGSRLFPTATRDHFVARMIKEI